MIKYDKILLKGGATMSGLQIMLLVIGVWIILDVIIILVIKKGGE